MYPTSSTFLHIWVIPPGWHMICDGVNCYIRKCTIYYPWLWLLINIVVISCWRWRDWFHSNLKKNCECALIITDVTIDTVTNRVPTWWNDPYIINPILVAYFGDMLALSTKWKICVSQERPVFFVFKLNFTSKCNNNNNKVFVRCTYSVKHSKVLI